VTKDIMYADNTLLVSRHESNLQAFLLAIFNEGMHSGANISCGKTLQIRIGTSARAVRPPGAGITCVREAVYLGGLVTCDGKTTNEISRRLGESGAPFRLFQNVWSHAAAPSAHRLGIYRQCDFSKPMYSLESLWLLRTDCDRLDAFHCRCLWRVLHVPHSSSSRSSNAVVLQRAGTCLLSDMVLSHQTNMCIITPIGMRP